MATARTEAEVVDSAAPRVRFLGLAEVEELIKLVSESDLSRLVWQRGEERLVVERGIPHIRSADAPALAPAPPAAAAAPAGTPVQAVPKVERAMVVTSPFVGTFYRAPSPDAPVFVEVGQAVQKGQVLCIVEAMKLMNEIEAESAGTVVEIFAQNGKSVEYGQKLFRIKKA